MNNQWWKEAVVYQIYPRSFMDSNGDGIGDIQGIISKLDYLKALGADVIWLSPIYQSPNDDNGYDISDYQTIAPEFGTMEDFDELLIEVHRREMKLIMDLVINHTSDEHPWFIESRSSKNNPYRDYYIWKSGKNGKEPNNWGSNFSGSAWQLDDKTNEYFLHLFSKKQPDLNWENPILRKDLYSMMKWWLDKGIDGFRLDVINFISKDQRFPDGEHIPGEKYTSGHKFYMNGPRIHEFLQEMNQEVLSAYDVMTVGEMPGATPEEAKLYTAENRNELNMIFTFQHMDIDSGQDGKWDVKPWSLVELKRIFSEWHKEIFESGWNSLYWNNHDQPRIVSRFGNDKDFRVKSAKMLATALHMMKGTPYIYQGEEIGMTNVRFDTISEYRDIETLNIYNKKSEDQCDQEEIMKAIHSKSRDNARTPMQWNNKKHAGFTNGEPWIKVNPNYKEINVKKAVDDADSIFYYYQQLIQLRKRYPIILYGDFKLLQSESEEIFAYIRTLNNDCLLTVSNFTKHNVTFEVPHHLRKYNHTRLIIGNDKNRHEQLEHQFILSPYETCVYYLNAKD